MGNSLKIAIVHEWFDIKGGSENVVSSLLNIYPNADLFALVDFFDDDMRTKVLKGKSVTTTFIQNLPFSKKLFRNYLSLFPIAIEQLDVSDYDLIISSSHAVAKGIITGPYQVHICYQYSPIRYAWDMYHTYFKEHKISGLKALILRYVLYRIRIWDVVSSNRVDYFIAISTLIQKRIQKYYQRDATVIFPPVDINRFLYSADKEDYYFTASRLVPYKKVKLIVESFNQSGKPLVIAGTGEQYKELKQMANSNIEMLGYCHDSEMVKLMQKAKAFVFTSYEDFGILPVEAMACGTPVIAYRKGGVQDTVIHQKTGILFDEQTIASLNGAIDEFESSSFDYSAISEYSRQFDIKVFEKKFKDFVDDIMKNRVC